MFRRGTIIGAMIIAACLMLIDGWAGERQAPFTGKLDVITAEAHTGEKRYYTVGTNGRRKEIEPFESDEVMMVSGSCFDAYIGERNGRRMVLNRIVDGRLYLDGEEIQKTPVHDRILELAAQLEHSIMQIRIYEVGEEYFACMDFNVNWHWPFDLYYYDPAADALVYIAGFESEEPVGFRMTEDFFRG